MRALVIDDSKAMRAIVGRMLREAGFEVFEAGNGREGLARLRQWEGIGLVLVDWNMPEMTGIEFVRAVRADRAFDSVRLLMVTAETERDQVAEALRSGSNEYLMKPFQRAALDEKLAILGVTGATPA